MQVKGSRLTIGCQQFPDVVHLLARLLGRFELLERDQCRCQRFRDDPFVVTGNSLFWHDDPHPLSGQRKRLPGWHYKPKPQIVTRAASVFWPLMYEQPPNEVKRGEVSQVIALSASPQWPAEGIKFGLCYRNLENLLA